MPNKIAYEGPTGGRDRYQKRKPEWPEKTIRDQEMMTPRAMLNRQNLKTNMNSEDTRKGRGRVRGQEVANGEVADTRNDGHVGEPRGKKW
jgi:hypothetical protein